MELFNFQFNLKIFLFISAAFDSQVSLRTVTRLITHKLTDILPTTGYPVIPDMIINNTIDTQNTILEIKFNPTLFIELRAFRAVRIRMTIPPDPTTHKYTPHNQFPPILFIGFLNITFGTIKAMHSKPPIEYPIAARYDELSSAKISLG
ncbi:MAG: hypothetical protein EZS28_020746 [Streblomastix strix]|uniref:Uncharacterized protein n=1 Tax=Streblomastix strix TaxID=222440 RepID=A0A5J4VN45_9EUKA|nr:MAG: hypothetical protein EZS28_020746 [Streblomastix strix]